MVNKKKDYPYTFLNTNIRKSYYEQIKTLDLSIVDFIDKAIGHELESYGKPEASLIRDIQQHRTNAENELRKAKSLEDLLSERTKEKQSKSEEDLKTNMLMDELKDLFKKRITNLGSYNEGAFKDWILSPKNKDRCKGLGKDPFTVLKELNEWYNQELKQ